MFRNAVVTVELPGVLTALCVANQSRELHEPANMFPTTDANPSHHILPSRQVDAST